MKKVIFAIVLVGIVLTLVGCGGNGVSCPSGYTLQGKTANNPDGFCKSGTGDVVAVIKTSTPGTDLGRDWKDAKSPLQQVECSLTNADICK